MRLVVLLNVMCIDTLQEAKKLLLKSVSIWLPTISEEETKGVPIEVLDIDNVVIYTDILSTD